jgi:hypothetical protein
MYRTGMALAALWLGGCNGAELTDLAAVQARLDTVLIKRQAAANALEATGRRRRELDALVGQLTVADLGTDPVGALQRALSGSARALDAAGRSFEISGTVQPDPLLLRLAALGREQPGLVLSHLQVNPHGFVLRLARPAPSGRPPPPPPMSTATAPPVLPDPGWLETERARHQRAVIAATYDRILQLDAAMAAGDIADAAIRQDTEQLAQVALGDRLPYAAEAAAVFLGGQPPWFTEAELDFRGNDLTVNALDPGAMPNSEAREAALRALFGEPHLERVSGREILKLVRLPIAVAGQPPPVKVPRAAR